jgi:hypothetical protein
MVLGMVWGRERAMLARSMGHASAAGFAGARRRNSRLQGPLPPLTAALAQRAEEVERCACTMPPHRRATARAGQPLCGRRPRLRPGRRRSRRARRRSRAAWSRPGPAHAPACRAAPPAAASARGRLMRSARSAGGCRPGTTLRRRRCCRRRPRRHRPAARLLIGVRRRCSAAWKDCRRERGSKGSAPRRASSVARQGRLGPARRPDHGAEATRVVQAQGAAVGDEVEVIVRPGFAGLRQQPSEPDMPRCSSRPGRARPSSPAGAATGTCRGGRPGPPCSPRAAASRPAASARACPAGRQHHGRRAKAVDAAPGDLDLGQFGHRTIM